MYTVHGTGRVIPALSLYPVQTGPGQLVTVLCTEWTKPAGHCILYRRSGPAGHYTLYRLGHEPAGHCMLYRRAVPACHCTQYRWAG